MQLKSYPCTMYTICMFYFDSQALALVFAEQGTLKEDQLTVAGLSTQLVKRIPSDLRMVCAGHKNSGRITVNCEAVAILIVMLALIQLWESAIVG